MTLVAHRRGSSESGLPVRKPVLRLWALPLRVHLTALALVLLALVPVVGTSASFSADEGAAILQAKSLARGGGWVVEHPVPEVDPTGAAYPIENSARGPRGVAPFAKHPLFALLLAGAARAGGTSTMVGLSLLGTLAAAGLAALLARRLDQGLGAPTLWVTGLASPLLFDGFLVVAHTLAAGLAAAAVLLALRAEERRSVGAALLVAPCVAAGVLLRTEFVFLALALAVTLFAVTIVAAGRRSGAALVAGAAAAGGALTARAAEAWWTRSILGGPAGGTPSAALASGGLAGRLRGFRLTWLTTGYGGLRPVDLALYVVLVAVVAGAWAARYRRHEQRLITGCAVVAGGAAVVAVLCDPANVVPGLLVAFPLVPAGLLLARRGTVQSTAARLAAVTSALFTIGVLASQYQRGGSGEWGGRYFALALPLAVPVLLLAVRDAGRRLLPSCRQAAACGLAVSCLALSVMGVAALRAAHQRNDGMNRAVARLAVRATPAGGHAPVVVAADGSLARQGWPTFDRVRWLLAPGDTAALRNRLQAIGVTEFLFVARTPADEGRLGPGTTVVAQEHGSGAGRAWYVQLVRSS